MSLDHSERDTEAGVTVGLDHDLARTSEFDGSH